VRVYDATPDVQDAESPLGTPRCWLHRCLPGEYLAMTLALHAGLGAMLWGLGAWQQLSGMAVVAAGVWIVGRAAGACSGYWFTPLVTAGLAVAVYAAWQAGAALPYESLAIFSPGVFLAMLAMILAADLVELTLSWPLAPVVSRWLRMNWHRLVVWAFALAVVVYLVVIPTAHWIFESLHPPKSGRVLEELSLAEQARLRSTEVLAALWFFALGGTIGSFLNVVAYRMPRGESIIFRRSRCPQCGTPIIGRDNVPIVGWLLLGGRCRACQAAISVRYPIVEWIAAALFLLLYFVELISGGANIPVRDPNHYHGVVWIIFYTKWDLVGLYLYHGFALSALLAWALIDIDRQRVPARAKWVVGATLLLLPFIWPSLLPVPAITHAAEWIGQPWLNAGVTGPLGGAVGVVVGWLTAWALQTSLSSGDGASTTGHLTSSLAIVGMTLGWQAAISLTLLALVLSPAAVGFMHWRRRLPPPLTAILLAAFVLHLVTWRWTTNHGSPWWPCHTTSVSGWIVVTMGYAGLLTANRQFLSRWSCTALPVAAPEMAPTTDAHAAGTLIAPSPIFGSELADEVHRATPPTKNVS